MRHRNQNQLYGYKQGPRKALIRSLVGSLVKHERILTTLVKAKEVRRHVERAITQAKKQNLHSRRLLLSRFPSKEIVSLMVKKISPRFSNRPGGYTRILKTACRSGDGSPMAYIEFVDYKKVPPPEEVIQETKKEEKEETQATKDDKAKKKPSFEINRGKAVKIKKQQKAQRKMKSLSRKEHRRQKV